MTGRRRSEPKADARRRERRVDPERDARRASRKAELLEAAIEVIRREGPAASMEDIAAEAGVTKPIVYRHFGDRSGLVSALSERFIEHLTAELRAALSRDAGPRELLVATIDAYLAVVEEDPHIYLFLVQRPFRDDSRAVQPLSSVMGDISRQVALVVGEQLRAVGRDSGAAEPWAWGLVGMVHAAGHWWIENKTMPRSRLVEYLASLVWDGMASTGLSKVAGPPASLAFLREVAE